MPRDTANQAEATSWPAPTTAAATIWADLLGLWTRPPQPAEAQILPVITDAARAVEHAVRSGQTMLEANRAAADALFAAIRRQQELVFSSTLAAFPTKAGTSEPWQRAVAGWETYGRGLEAAWTLTSAAFTAQRRALATVACQAKPAPVCP